MTLSNVQNDQLKILEQTVYTSNSPLKIRIKSGNYLMIKAVNIINTISGWFEIKKY